MRPLGLELLGVPSDAHGPCCASLREVLCARREQGKPLPKLMYCVPVSANPTGITWSMRRKEEMYALACEFDFLLLEDGTHSFSTHSQLTRLAQTPTSICSLMRLLAPCSLVCMVWVVPCFLWTWRVAWFEWTP